MTKFVIQNTDQRNRSKFRIIKTETSVVDINPQWGAILAGVYTLSGCLELRPTPALMWSMNTDLPMWDQDPNTVMWLSYPMWSDSPLLWSSNEADLMWRSDVNELMWSSRPMWNTDSSVLMWN